MGHNSTFGVIHIYLVTKETVHVFKEFNICFIPSEYIMSYVIFQLVQIPFLNLCLNLFYEFLVTKSRFFNRITRQPKLTKLE